MNHQEQARHGFNGYVTTLSRHGEAQMNAWRRLGGRKRNPTYEELAATRESRASRQGKEVVRIEDSTRATQPRAT